MATNKSIKVTLEQYLRKSWRQFEQDFLGAYQNHLSLKNSYITFIKQPYVGEIAKQVYCLELVNDWNA